VEMQRRSHHRHQKMTIEGKELLSKHLKAVELHEEHRNICLPGPVLAPKLAVLGG